MAEKDQKPAAPVTPAASATGSADPKPATGGTPAPAAASAAGATGKPADAKPAEKTPSQVARMKLDEVTKARRDAESALAAADKAKKEAEPLVGKAKEFDAQLATFATDPAAFLEKFGLDVNAVTEKLAARAIEQVRAKTPDGRIDELQKQVDAMKEAEKKAKEDATAADRARARDGYVKTLTAEAVDKTKYPHAFRALSKMGEGAGQYLWNVGKGLFEQSAKDVPAEKRGELPAPTAEAIAKEVESYFADLAKTLTAPLDGEEEGDVDGKKPEQTGGKSAEQLVKEAEARRAAKKAAENKPVGKVEKPAMTLAERRAAVRAAAKKSA